MIRIIRTLSPTDAAYIAGIIDGEGTVTLTREHANENRRLVISISSTEMALLRFVKDTIDAGRITTKRTYSDRHTPSFTYRITSRQALELLRQVHPFLRGYKRERAALVLAHYLDLTPRNGRYTPEQREARTRFEQVVLEVKPE